MSDEKTKKHPSIDRKRVDETLAAALAAHPDVLRSEDKTGWRKVTSTKSGCKVYIQLRDDVREVHLSGFGEGLPGTVPPPRKNGKVLAHLDMNGSDPYAALAAVFDTLAGLTEVEKAAPAPKAPKEAKVKPVSDDERVKRIAARVEALGLGDAPASATLIDVSGESQPTGDAAASTESI